ncbi:MAG: DUF6444 domain-containing protein [Bacteroidota bacterium]
MVEKISKGKRKTYTTGKATAVTLPTDIATLQSLVLTLLEKIGLLEAEVARLQAENTDLRQQLNQNSQNSSLPPSSDRFKAKPAFPKANDSLKGGQLGHKGKTLEMSACPDQIVALLPPAQCSCGSSLHAAPVIT